MSVDKRRGQRYSGISLNVLFSPVTGANVTELAESYLSAVSHDMSLGGMSFDVTELLEVESVLVISVPNDRDSNDELRAIVRWCTRQGDGNYRVGLSFDTNFGIAKSFTRQDVSSVLHGPGVPAEMALSCPACNARTTFAYKGMQPCWGDNNELPLYDCKACGTTRSITSLLGFNRRLCEDDAG